MHPESTIVNIGCGFDHRFDRIDNGRILFFDLDLPDVLTEKHKILPASDRFQYISGSVFDTEWIGQLPRRPTLLLAEGVFMYTTEDQVQGLFEALGKGLGSFEIFFEVYNSRWLTGWRKKITERKLKKALQFGAGAFFSFGIADSSAIESWDPAFKLVDEWSWFDSDHPSLGMLKFFRHIEWLRKIQWSVHYRHRH
jgi:O-methyltransferase involved in polyketide biosynthesis